VSPHSRHQPVRARCHRQAAAAFDGHPAVEIDRLQRLTEHRPAHVAFPDVDALAHAVRIGRVQPVVLDVNPDHLIAERENPLLGRREPHVVADVEIRLDPRALERADEVAEQSRLDPQVVGDVFQRDDDLGLFRERDQAADPLPRRVGGQIVGLDVVREPRVVAIDHAREVSRLLVELDLIFPVPRHRHRRAASLARPDPAGHEQDRVGAEGLGGAQRALGHLERLLGGVGVVELRPAARDGVNAQADFLRNHAHLRGFFRGYDTPFDAVEAGGLDLGQVLFGRPRDERLAELGLEGQRRGRSRRRRPRAASLGVRARRAAKAQAGRERGRRGDELATVDRCLHLLSPSGPSTRIQFRWLRDRDRADYTVQWACARSGVVESV
jgi:hypothetical protein